MGRQSIILMLGYLIGQGAAFLGQFIVKILSSGTELGVAVLILSFFSFAFQFSDFGNSTYVVREYSKGNARNVRAFLKYRACLAFVATVAMLFYGYLTTYFQIGLTEIVVIPLIATVAGLSAAGISESLGDYKKFAVLQNMPWFVVGLTLPVYSLANNSNANIVPVLWLIVVAVSVKFSRRTLLTSKYPAEVSGKKISTGRNLMVAFSHVAPPLGGQVLGRVILLTVQRDFGLSMLGNYGLAKYGQVACTLLFSFWIRPIHREISALDEPITTGLFKVVFSNYRAPLVASFVIMSISLAVNYFWPYLLGGNSSWVLLLTVCPFWMLANIASQMNSRLFEHSRFLFLEYFGLILNWTIFCGIDSNDVVLKIISGEIIQYIFLVGITIFRVIYCVEK